MNKISYPIFGARALSLLSSSPKKQPTVSPMQRINQSINNNNHNNLKTIKIYNFVQNLSMNKYKSF